MGYNKYRIYKGLNRGEYNSRWACLERLMLLFFFVPNSQTEMALLKPNQTQLYKPSPSQNQYLSKSTKITTNTERAMLSTGTDWRHEMRSQKAQGAFFNLNN